jgi:hypothetical protein
MKVIEHDFDAVNRHIEWEQQRKNELLKQRRVSTFERWGKVWLLASLSIGLLILCIAFAYWFLGHSNEIIRVYNLNENSTKEEVLALQDVLNNVQKDVSNLVARKPLNEAEVLKKIKESESKSGDDNTQTINTSFTVFETIDSVVTGRIYDPSNLDEPESQYCYLSSPMEGKSLSEDLGNLKKGGVIIWVQNVSLEKLALGQEKCRFLLK